LLYFNLIFWIGGLELIRNYGSLALIFLGLEIVLIFLTVLNFTKNSFNKRFFNFLITPLIFAISFFGLLLLIENPWWYHGLTIGAGFFLYLFLEQILNYFYFAVRYQPYTLENFSFYWNMLAVFAVSASLFAALLFVGIKVWYLTAFFFIVIFILTKQIYWVNKIEWTKYAIFCWVTALTMSELFLVLNYLPTSYLVNGIVMAIVFYVMTGLGRLFLQDKLNARNIFNYLIMGGASLIAVLATAQWT
jgi:hypothetical protein